MYTQDLLLMFVEDMTGKAAVGLGHLSHQHAAHAMILLGHVSNCFSSAVHNDVSVCLLEPEKDVHHLDLSLDDQRAVVE